MKFTNCPYSQEQLSTFFNSWDVPELIFYFQKNDPDSRLNEVFSKNENFLYDKNLAEEKPPVAEQEVLAFVDRVKNSKEYLEVLTKLSENSLKMLETEQSNWEEKGASDYLMEVKNKSKDEWQYWLRLICAKRQKAKKVEILLFADPRFEDLKNWLEHIKELRDNTI